MHPHPPAWKNGEGLKIVAEILILVVVVGDGGRVILLVGNFYKMHLLSSDKIFFSMAIWRKCLEHSVAFPVNVF